MYRPKTLPVSLREALNQMITQDNFPNELIYQIARKMNSASLQLLLPIVVNHKQVISSIKFLIFIHNIVFNDNQNRAQSIDRLLLAIGSSINRQSTPFEKLLLEKLVIPYRLYLQKRNLYNEAQIYRQGRESHPYILINLIQNGLSFINILFTIGRYLFKQYKFLSEFNIILAKDMSTLYQKLKNKMSEEFRFAHAQIIESINQNLFTVFYNCYFCSYVSCFAPVWIDTDQLITHSQVQSRITLKKSRKSHGSYKELDRLSFECDSTSNLSICCIQSNESSVLDLKSTSTIASLREVNRDDPLSQKQIQQRLDFIATASSLLNEYKQHENTEQENITSLTAF